MKTILINASNLKVGGGIQVADSICCELIKHPEFKFIVVLSDYLENTGKKILGTDNITIVNYNIKNSLQTLLFGRDRFLDSLVKKNHVDVVITVFGPSRWNPCVPHISGFAMAHLVLSNSPYFKNLNLFDRIKSLFRIKLLDIYFKRSAGHFYTENPFITALLQKKWPEKTIHTISNNYNQIYNTPEAWNNIKLPAFNGTTILCISANYPHKNLHISIAIAQYLKSRHPDFKFRFVFTINPTDLIIPENLRNHFVLTGKVDISQCPSLYNQSDIVFQPSLLECFTATYTESMKMRKPIITTDLDFARGLCDKAALYYSPMDATDAAEKIIALSQDKKLELKLIEAGEKQLLKFDSAESRCQKILKLAENLI